MTAQIRMNLITLLEAARYVEMQEEEQQRVAEATALHQTTNQPSIPSNNNNNNNKRPQQQQQTHQTVLITEVQPTTILHSSLINNVVVQQQQQPAPPQEKIEQPEQQPQVSSTTTHLQRQRLLQNSFDIINNPLGLDDNTTSSSTNNDINTNNKRKNPPMVFRAGTREVHNKLEKHRRAHLKECFDVLKKQLPAAPDEKKTSNLSILHSALRCIQALKRRERELEHEMERLARDKISAQQRLAVLKKDISSKYDNVDFSKILPDVIVTTNNTTTTTTTTTNHQINQNVSGDDVTIKIEPIVASTAISQSINYNQNHERIPVPLLPNKTQLSIATTAMSGTIKAEMTQPVQTTALSVMPVGYPGLVLQKVALVSNKGLTDLVSTHFITPQQLNGKVVPLVNAQYVVKPVVVVSRPS